jgi:heme/copper-type cytochrome/quinol oxidase subunit 1
MCVVPKQIGSPSIAFPRAAAAAAWTWLGAAIVYVVAVAADGSYGGESSKAALLGNVAVGGLVVALLLGAICVAVTVLTLRPEGMGLADVPFFSWSLLVATGIWVLTFPAVMAHVIIGQITHSSPDTLIKTTYLEGVAWLFVQPAIYLVLIPVAGFAVDAVATAVGGRQRFRGTVQVLIGFLGLVSYGAWAQGRDGRSTVVWVAVTLAAGLPLLGLLGAMGDTLGQGRPKIMSPLASAFLALLVALLGAGVGMLQTVNTFGHGNLGTFDIPSLQLAQMRIVFGAAIVGAVGALFYWGRQVTGSVVADGLGKLIAPALAVGAVLWGVPWLIQALAKTDNPELFAGLATAGAVLLALGVLGAMAALAKASATASRGDELLADVWGGGGTLEWAEPTDEPVTVESPYPVLDAAGKADS